MGWRMYGAKKWEDKSKNPETSGFVSLFSKLMLKSSINKHIFPLYLFLKAAALDNCH